MNQVDFLKEMVKDLDRHKETIQKRIKELGGEIKENQEEVKEKPSKLKKILGNIVDGIVKTYK